MQQKAETETGLMSLPAEVLGGLFESCRMVLIGCSVCKSLKQNLINFSNINLAFVMSDDWNVHISQLGFFKSFRSIQTRLNLRGLNLKGAPTAGLVKFDVGNHILSSITYLDLRSNAITDAQCGHLAKNLARLNRLVFLNLGENSIYSAGIIDVCYSSSTITDLNLSRNFSEFDKQRLGIVDHLAKAIEQVSFLKSLDVSGNCCGAAAALKLSNKLKYVSSLTTIKAGGNSIQHTGARGMARAMNLSHVPGLTQLELNCNGIGCKGSKYLASGFRGAPELRVLNLSSNRLGERGASFISKGLQYTPALSTLIIADNNIGRGGAIAIAEALLYIPHLTLLDLSCNFVGDSGAFYLASHMSMVPELISLVLCWNLLGFCGICHIGKSLQSVPKLQCLDISFNDIGDVGSEHLVTQLHLVSALTILNVSCNKISDTCVEKLVPFVCKLPNLMFVSFEENCNRLGVNGTSFLAAAIEKSQTLHGSHGHCLESKIFSKLKVSQDEGHIALVKATDQFLSFLSPAIHTLEPSLLVQAKALKEHLSCSGTDSNSKASNYWVLKHFITQHDWGLVAKSFSATDIVEIFNILDPHQAVATFSMAGNYDLSYELLLIPLQKLIESTNFPRKKILLLLQCTEWLYIVFKGGWLPELTFTTSEISDLWTKSVSMEVHNSTDSESESYYEVYEKPSERLSRLGNSFLWALSRLLRSDDWDTDFKTASPVKLRAYFHDMMAWLEFLKRGHIALVTEYEAVEKYASSLLLAPRFPRAEIQYLVLYDSETLTYLYCSDWIRQFQFSTNEFVALWNEGIGYEGGYFHYNLIQNPFCPTHVLRQACLHDIHVNRPPRSYLNIISTHPNSDLECLLRAIVAGEYECPLDSTGQAVSFRYDKRLTDMVIQKMDTVKNKALERGCKGFSWDMQLNMVTLRDYWPGQVLVYAINEYTILQSDSSGSLFCLPTSDQMMSSLRELSLKHDSTVQFLQWERPYQRGLCDQSIFRVDREAQKPSLDATDDILLKVSIQKVLHSSHHVYGARTLEMNDSKGRPYGRWVAKCSVQETERLLQAWLDSRPIDFDSMEFVGVDGCLEVLYLKEI